MIVLILFITAFGPVSAQQYPDYFAVSVGAEFFENSEYKVFTRMDCIDPVYIHDGNGNARDRVLFRSGSMWAMNGPKWILGSLENTDNLECQKIASTADKEYESSSTSLMSTGLTTVVENWINIKESSGFFFRVHKCWFKKLQ